MWAATSASHALAQAHARRRGPSIHTIITRRRESLYGLTILFTFALGTAASDGLGLALSRRLARAAGGDVVADAGAAGGCFVVRLPLA